MNRQVLITGGAGFIGSYVADELLRAGCRVRALDALVPQVHETQARPAYLASDVELVVGDVRHRETVRRALRGVDAVFHFAAMVGVGQSMYQIENYTATNNVGTAVLLEELTSHPVERLVIASSMSVYGEGLYATPGGQYVSDAARTNNQLRARQWEVRGRDGAVLTPLPTPETKVPALASVYALSKFDQEQMGLIVGRAYNIPTVALRFFNAYGPRQALSNPYTGVLAIFASRLLNNRRPLVFEDGLQQRDFVNVRDVAAACRLAMEAASAVGGVFNIGSGHAVTVRGIAEQLAQIQNRPELTPVITHTYRRGDIRHCFADITLARMALGYQPQVTLTDGLRELSGWLDTQVAVDRVAEAGVELASRGLTV